MGGLEGATLLFRATDLKDERDILGLFDEVKDRFGGVDVLVNNAGLGQKAPLLSGETEQWREMLEVSVLALFICTRKAIQDIKARGSDGRIVYVEEETGLDWRDSLILSATHTHSGPARHWPLPPDPYLPIGSFGIGDFSQGIHDALVRSTAEAALAALEARAPARLGWHIEEAFDVEDRIARDRRPESPPFDDNRALLIRDDDEQGVPRGDHQLRRARDVQRHRLRLGGRHCRRGARP